MPQRVLNYHIHNKFYVFTWTWIYIYTTQGPIVNEIVEEGPQLSWRAVRDKGREAGELEPGLRIRSGSGSGHLGRFRASAFFMSRTGQRIISRTRIGTKLRNRSVPGSGYFGRIRMWFQFSSRTEPDKRLEGADLEKRVTAPDPGTLVGSEEFCRNRIYGYGSCYSKESDPGSN